MSDFEFTDYAGTYEVLILAKVKLPSDYVDSACDDVYVLTSRIVMKHIATEVSIIEPHPLHVVVSYVYPLVIR